MANNVDAVADLLASTGVEDFEISFADQGLKLDTEDDAKPIVEAILQSSHLTALKLEGNTVGIAAAKAIAKALEAHSEFKYALWNNMFTGRLKTEIPEALTFLSSGLMLGGAQLVELDLSDNAFGAIGVNGIQDVLQSPTCYTLKTLRLNNNGLGIAGGKALAKALLECYSKSKENGSPLALRSFFSGRNRLENEGAKALAEVFKSLKSLEEIAMPQNGIYFEGISALAEAFSYNSGLRQLNLNDNTFTEKGAKAMAQALPKLQNLEIINFGDCLIKDKGAGYIAEELKNGQNKLKELILESNEIRKDGALAIAESMANKKQLEKLNLNANAIGEEGRDHIKEVLNNLGCNSALDSLSDDEEDDDNDNDNGVEDDESGNENNDVENELETKNNTSHSLNELNDDVHFSPCTLDEFLKSPAPEKLLGLGNNKTEFISAHIDKGFENVEMYIDLFIKISSVVTNLEGNVTRSACECADTVFKKAFEYVLQKELLSIFSNTLLIHLGLIKSEDKKFKPVSTLSGPLIVLEHTIRQPYFPRDTKEILQVFLSRPNSIVESTGNVKHKLMQTLYRY